MSKEYKACGTFARSKVFGFYLPATIEVGKRYYFNDSPELDKEIVTGIDSYSYDALNPNYPKTVFINGRNYNTIAVGDVYKCIVVFNDADGNLILKNPLSTFSRFATVNNTPSLMPRNYNFKMRSGKSFFLFVELPVTPSPVFIPFNFHFKT